MNKKRIMQIVALVVVLSMMFTTAAFAMSPGHNKQLERTMNNYEVAASYMKDKAIIKGYGNGDFGFNDYVKRGDIAVMIVRAFKLSTLINEYEEAFDDVDDDNYFYYAVLTAKKFGIAKGDGKNFNPNKMVTVEEAILMIERSEAVANSNVDIEEVQLRELFDEDELDDYATRQDIALMLYKVLTGVDYDGDVEGDDDEIGVVEYVVDEDEAQPFDEEDFEDAFEELDADNEDDSLEYVKFILPVRNGKLYYNYNENNVKKTLVNEDDEYFVDDIYLDEDDELIDNITFVPIDNYSGTVTIKYYAYDEKGNSYPGFIKITVDGDENQEIDTIGWTIEKGENDVLVLDFDEKLEKEINDLDYVMFDLPEYGTLKIKYDGTYYTFDPSDLNAEFDIDKINELNYIYNGTREQVSIYFTAYDLDGNAYDGEIEVTVDGNENQEIDTIGWTIENGDNNVKVLNFDEELEKEFSDLDYVMFELPEYGTLKIEYDGTYYTFDSSDLNAKFDIEKIEELTYIYNGTKEQVSIYYTAYDNDDNAYDGEIEVTVE